MENHKIPYIDQTTEPGADEQLLSKSDLSSIDSDSDDSTSPPPPTIPMRTMPYLEQKQYYSNNHQPTLGNRRNVKFLNLKLDADTTKQ